MDFGLGLLGIGASLFGQNQTNQMQAEMMQQQQSFQERMSSTAYQRASADMQAAGLNPMMMFNSGSAASTPAGASPSPMVKSGLDADSMQKSISSAVQQKVASATIDNLVAQNAKIKAETLTEGNRPALLSAQTDTEKRNPMLKDAQTGEAWQRGSNLRTVGTILDNDALTAINEGKINSSAREAADQGAYIGRKSSQVLRPVTDVISTAKGAKSILQPWDKGGHLEDRYWQGDKNYYFNR